MKKKILIALLIFIFGILAGYFIGTYSKSSKGSLFFGTKGMRKEY